MFVMEVLFHVAIAGAMGLSSFLIAMLASLILCLRSPVTPVLKPATRNPAGPEPSVFPCRQEVAS